MNREGGHGVVKAAVEEANRSEEFTLIIAPKGTRSRRDYWKSGFYRICLETGLPLQLGFIDSRTRTYGWSGNITLTGDRHGPDPRVLRGQARQTTGQLERPPAPGGRGVIPAARLRPNPADLTK